MIHVHQINLQRAIGGGEVYTRWFTRTLVDAGAQVTLYVDPSNAFWKALASDRVRIIGLNGADRVVAHLPDRGALIITQSRVPEALAQALARNHVLTGFAHMPMLGRSSEEFARYDTVFTVSEYCVGLLRKAGIAQAYPTPMYGTGESLAPGGSAESLVIRARSPYRWDLRKGRDRLFSMLEPAVRAFRRRSVFARTPDLTLGIVSLLSPIKQFPALFSLLAPRIAEVPGVRLEIFGDGGYAQVRDIRRALAPIANRVRFWGYQAHVRAIYPQLDYLMTGLPEKEALGLNVLEAQSLGTPVLAPRAAPFTETMIDGKSGYLYRDPREDEGEAFGELLTSLARSRTRPDPRSATEHLGKFTYPAMVDRTRVMLDYVVRRFPKLNDRNKGHE